MLYHYTCGHKLEPIETDGFIATSPKAPKYPERPVAWLSSNAQYEMTALKLAYVNGESRLLTLEEMRAQVGVFRYVFSDTLDVLPWSLLKTRSKMKPKYVKRLIERGKSCSANPEEWFGTLEPIPLSEALRLEMLIDGGAWVEVDRNVIRPQNQVMSLTVDEAASLSLGVQCTNETWRI